MSDRPVVLADALEHLEARHVRQAEVEHDAVARLLGHRRQCRRAGIGDHDLEIVVAEQLRDAQLLGGVVLDDQQTLAPRRGVGLDPRDRRLQPFRRRRLGDERERAARQPVLAILFERDDLHRDVPRLGILLQLAEHRPSEHVGQEHVERHRHRPELARQAQRLAAAHGDEHLEALVVRQVHEDPRVVRVVLDDEQRRVVRLQIVAIVERPPPPDAPARARPEACTDGAWSRRRSRPSPIAAVTDGPAYRSGR